MKEKNELKSFSFPFLFSHFLFLDNAEHIRIWLVCLPDNQSVQIQNCKTVVSQIHFFPCQLSFFIDDDHQY